MHFVSIISSNNCNGAVYNEPAYNYVTLNVERLFHFAEVSFFFIIMIPLKYLSNNGMI